MSNSWRVASPPAHIDHEVHKLALSENRSTSNMILRLVIEALRARRERSTEPPQSHDHTR
jgi:hypothetical protein